MSKVTKTLKTDEPKIKWQPATLLDNIKGLDTEEFTYRWVNTDHANLAKKQAEGWDVVNSNKGGKEEHERANELKDGAPLTDTLTEYRDLVLMKMPKELADARSDYYKQVHDDRISGLVSNAKSQPGGSVIEGQIKIGNRVID